MRRQVLKSDLEQLYTANDMVKAGCGGCTGCSECCRGMGESAVVDPMDVWRLCRGLGVTFSELMESALELHTVDGCVLPNLKMVGGEECCAFLNEQGRCSVHAYRPGVCRLFPLGRYYENGSFRYFLQRQECPVQPKTKVKISKWLEIADIKRYEQFVLDWHNFLESVRNFLRAQDDEQLAKDFNVQLLNTFYAAPYEGEDFFALFAGRLAQMRRLLQILAQKTPE